MLAEENKNSGPSALDGKSEEVFFFPYFHRAPCLSAHIASHSVSLKQLYAGMYC